MIALSSIRLIQGIFGYFIFLLGSQTGERLSFAEMLQKPFPSITDEILKVPLCFICQKNSHCVRITWLKGYSIVSTYKDARAWQSWGGNLRTPCSETRFKWSFYASLRHIVTFLRQHRPPLQLKKVPHSLRWQHPVRFFCTDIGRRCSWMQWQRRRQSGLLLRSAALPPSLNVALRCTESFTRPRPKAWEQYFRLRPFRVD